MKGLKKRIAFVYLPHIFAESEEKRENHLSDLPLIVVSGSSPKSIVLDYSKTLEGSVLKKGAFVKDIELLEKRIKVIAVDYDYVETVNQKVIQHLKNYSPSVENQKTGEYFLDLTGTRRLFGRELDTCGKIITELKHSFGFSAHIGIGSNVLIPRLASQVAGDGGIYDIFETAEGTFLSPLSVELLPDLSPSVIEELISNYNINSTGDLKVFSKSDLTCMFGREGMLLYSYSRGLSRNSLIEKKTEKALKSEFTISSENNDDGSIRRYFFDMILELCIQMREEYVFPGAFEIVVVYQDNYRYSYRGRLRNPSFFERWLYKELLFYLNRALRRRTCIKRIVLSFSDFAAPSFQLALFHDTSRMGRLAGAFDLIRKRFGRRVIHYGA